MKKFLISIILILFAVTEIVAFSLGLKYYLHPLKFKDLIVEYSNDFNLDPAFVASIINVESGFDKNAKSSKGAIGLMQIMPTTANYICMLNHTSYTDLFSPEENIKIGCNYLLYLFDKFQDRKLVIVSYNAGETQVKKWLNDEEYSSDGKTLNIIPYKETREYLNKVEKNILVYSKYKF